LENSDGDRRVEDKKGSDQIAIQAGRRKSWCGAALKGRLGSSCDSGQEEKKKKRELTDILGNINFNIKPS